MVFSSNAPPTPLPTSILTSRPTSPTSSSDEKRATQQSIEVPGIVLTEAQCDYSSRASSPPPKQIVLLNPACVAYPPSPSRTLGGALGTRIGGPMALRTIVLLVLFALAVYHLYAQLDLAVVSHVPAAAMQP